jgi:hypothetical protein
VVVVVVVLAEPPELELELELLELEDEELPHSPTIVVSVNSLHSTSYPSDAGYWARKSSHGSAKAGDATKLRCMTHAVAPTLHIRTNRSLLNNFIIITPLNFSLYCCGISCKTRQPGRCSFQPLPEASG